MGITIIRDTGKASSEYSNYAKCTNPKMSIKEILDKSKYYRHPDSATISYAKIVENQSIGTIPPDKFLNIGIVGGGSSGICALYELSKIAKAGKNPIMVTIYETDKNSFLFSDRTRIPQKRGGRLFAAAVCDDSEVKTIYEVGAMRFPETAGLTWYYAGEVFGDQSVVEPFPNPGVVATEFVFGNRVDRYKGSEWEDPSSPTLQVKNLVISKLWEGYDFKIGNRTPKAFSELLKKKDTNNQTLKDLHRDWNTFVTKYDGTTLGSAVRKIISKSIDCLPDVGLNQKLAKINYYLELFGRFGFGTGGFKPVFNASLVEIVRLLLWDYSAEYSLPVEENTDLIEELFMKANEVVYMKIKTKCVKVCDVFHKSDRSSASVAFYKDEIDVTPDNDYVFLYKNNEVRSPDIEHHDYVILAIPHLTASKIINRFGSTTKPILNGQVGNPSTGTKRLNYSILPPLLLSINQEAANAQMIAAVNNMHMLRSAKVFATIKKKHADKAPKFNNERIRAVLSDCGLASSYMIPSPTEEGYFTFLVSYTWEDDSTKQQYDYHSSGYSGSSVFSKMVDRSQRWVRKNHGKNEDEYELWWLAKILKLVEKKNRFFFDWSTNSSAGGFKLDMPGDFYQSNLCFRYHTHAKSTSLNNRFFLASCSYTHLGGWVEGAFMSAINAVSGIVVAANGGGENGINKLNNEAKKLFKDLDPVI